MYRLCSTASVSSSHWALQRNTGLRYSKGTSKFFRCRRLLCCHRFFEGSPKNMTQLCQGVMAIVHKIGRPKIFLNMIWNPNWLELTEVFQEKGKLHIVSYFLSCKLKNDILKNNVQGVVVAYVVAQLSYSENRCLPRWHMLINLENNSKFKEAVDIHWCICAELPDWDCFPKHFGIDSETCFYTLKQIPM